MILSAVDFNCSELEEEFILKFKIVNRRRKIIYCSDLDGESYFVRQESKLKDVSDERKNFDIDDELLKNFLFKFVFLRLRLRRL